MRNDKHINQVNEHAAGADGVLERMHDELKETLAGDYSERKAVHSYVNLQTNFDSLSTNYK